MNWPQPFLDAGFTDREIAGYRWHYNERNGHMEFRKEGTDHYVIYCDEQGWLYLFDKGEEYTIPPLPSMELARKAAEDLVCRLHGVPTEAERELAEYQRIWNDPVALHLNLLNNPKLSKAQLRHLLGDDTGENEMTERMSDERLAELEAKLMEFRVCGDVGLFTPEAASRLFGLFEESCTALRAERATVDRYQWRPIETAPEDGKILVTGGTTITDLGRHREPLDGVAHVYWEPKDHFDDNDNYVGAWVVCNACYYSVKAFPTHWMPLPPAPVSEGGA